MVSTKKLAYSANGAAGLAAFVALTVGACGAVPQEAPPARSLSALRARPLSVPAIAAGSTCPTSQSVRLRTGSVVPLPAGTRPPNKGIPAYGYGAGPVYLSGQMVGPIIGLMGAPGWSPGQAALIVVDPSYSGPVLVRGHQADGPGGFPLSSPSGELTFADTRSSPDYRSWVGQIAAPPGCYALQADTISGTALIWFLVLAGPWSPTG